MAEYRLFFSWQSDRKDTRKIIKGALKTAKDILLEDGIELFIDEDTRERVGKRNIESEVLEKILKCDIFLADLTPAITYFPPKDSHDLPKHMPNSNVMYEYGYALHAKGENRMIVLASLDKTNDEHIEYMPFDISHDTITLFKDEHSLHDLHKWIRRIIEDVDKERAAYIPQYACTMLFRTDEGFSKEITIHPRYKRIRYTVMSHRDIEPVESEQPSMADLLNNPFKLQQALISRLNVVPATLTSAKIVNKTTNLSYVPINLLFVNQGSEALDNLRITIKASDDRVTFTKTNIDEGNHLIFLRVKHETDTFVDEEGIFQKASTVNPHASIIFDEVFVHAPHDIGSFSLMWELSSRTHQDAGELLIHVESEYEYDSYENEELAGQEKIEDLEISE